MNKFGIYVLKVLRKVYAKVFCTKIVIKEECVYDPETAANLIYKTLQEDKPCMIARFGSNELLTIITYLGIKESDRNIFNYIKGKSLEWWWNERNLDLMQDVAGFFPRQYKYYEKFSQLMLKEIDQVDILGSWISNEKHLKQRMNCKKVHLRLLEPFWSDFTWTKALEGKKVLVIHPFDTLILNQYKSNRQNIFRNKNILPEFEIQTLKAVQSHGEQENKYNNWFEALEWMKDEIDKRDYDICLIGAGAYGFPLAAHVKRSGKKAFHVGGSLQLLFGIIGKRWEDPNYGVKKWGIPRGSYSNLINEYWVRPGDEFKPQNIQAVEDGWYW